MKSVTSKWTMICKGCRWLSYLTGATDNTWLVQASHTFRRHLPHLLRVRSNVPHIRKWDGANGKIALQYAQGPTWHTLCLAPDDGTWSVLSKMAKETLESAAGLRKCSPDPMFSPSVGILLEHINCISIRHLLLWSPDHISQGWATGSFIWHGAPSCIVPPVQLQHVPSQWLLTIHFNEIFSTLEPCASPQGKDWWGASAWDYQSMKKEHTFQIQSSSTFVLL